ncbi:MAG: hypothetical protein GX454_03345 [Brooklawnia sp.]|nr:hypothetical protein [Brooklawnia sp.]
MICAILVWSGVAKVRQPEAMASAMGDLRVPGALASKPVQLAIPWVEIGLALLLLVTGGIWQSLAWIATLLLFVAYLVLIAAALGRQERVSCNCFGAASSAPVSRGTLARNILLVIGAAIGLVASLLNPSPLVLTLFRLDWRGWFGLLALAVVGGLAWLLSREGAVDVSDGSAAPVTPAVTELDSDAEPLDYLRTPIPNAVLEREPGEFVRLPDLAKQRGVLVICVSVTCGSCAEIIAKVDDFAERLPLLDVVVLVTSRGAIDQLPETVRPRAAVDVAGSVAKGLELNWVPGGVLLGADGLLAGGPVYGDAIKQLVDDVAQQFDLAAETSSDGQPAAVQEQPDIAEFVTVTAVD